MIKINIIGGLVALLATVSCNFNASINKDFMTGITTSGNGISAENVSVNDGEKGLKTRSFKYGQKIYTNFENLEGFEIENGKYYPDMSVWIISKKGDTIMNYADLYKGKPVDASVNSLDGSVVLARPVVSNMEYTISYHISDTKGNGSFSSKMDFMVVPDESIKVTKNGLDFDEVYIMNAETGEVITDNKVKSNQKIYLYFQGLYGYSETGNEAELGLRVKVTDAAGKTIIEEADIFDKHYFNATELQSGIASTLVISPGLVDNPWKWQVVLWDKNSDAKLNAVTEISIE